MPFDASEILNTSVDKAMSTDYINIPEGKYPGVIGADIKVRGVDVDGQSRLVLDIPWSISDPEVAKATGRERNLCSMGVFLEMDGSQISTAEGANVKLGRLRAAVGQNDGSWRPADLSGAAALCTITHSLSKGVPYANVTDVEPL